MDKGKKNDEVDEILQEVHRKRADSGKPGEYAPPAQADESENSANSSTAETASGAADTDNGAENGSAAAENSAAAEPANINSEKAEHNMKKEGKALNKKLLAAIIAAIILIAAIVGIYFGLNLNKDNTQNAETESSQVATTQNTQAENVEVVNPLTGESDFSESALNTRYLSVVVENSAAARPQYNMDSADIVFEVEVEGGITRMLWVYADMSSLPSQVGPVRSARPVLVELSELFDSVFVHYGGSHSAGNYVGAYDIISNDSVDDIDGMSVSSCFKRTSDKSSPHNAALLGSSIVSSIENQGYSTDKSSSVTQLSFYDELTAVSDAACSSVSVTISSVTDTHTLTYDSESGLYTNVSDYGTSVSFSNIIVLYANTSYVSTSSYTYCLYTLTSGSGKLISGGAAQDITWDMSGNVLTLTDSSGQEVKLNKGTSWVAVASANNGGSVSVS
ncbi:MAG: DUF3048 domain-containing protein [Clostridiales bacterium]|nr:DUF3048 domain-containing protein [Clostridiales bacterium]